MTEIPAVHLETICKKDVRCKFVGKLANKIVCLKNTPFAPAVIQLEINYSKEASVEHGDPEPPKGDNCPGVDKVIRPIFPFPIPVTISPNTTL